MSNPVLVSSQSYVVEVPTLGAFGTVSKVEVTRVWSEVGEHKGEDGEFDAVILSGLKADITFDYTYISGASTPPETMHATGAPVTLTDATATMLPGKVLITEVTHTAEKGKERVASCKGMWMPFFSSLT